MNHIPLLFDPLILSVYTERLLRLLIGVMPNACRRTELNFRVQFSSSTCYSLQLAATPVRSSRHDWLSVITGLQLRRTVKFIDIHWA
jgi:hypothetical protein